VWKITELNTQAQFSLMDLQNVHGSVCK